MPQEHDFYLRKIYMRDGLWVREDIPCTTRNYDKSVAEFKEAAYAMDKEFGDSHAWTITMRSENGDYFQVFHERVISGYMDY